MRLYLLQHLLVLLFIKDSVCCATSLSQSHNLELNVWVRESGWSQSWSNLASVLLNPSLPLISSFVYVYCMCIVYCIYWGPHDPILHPSVCLSNNFSFIPTVHGDKLATTFNFSLSINTQMAAIHLRNPLKSLIVDFTKTYPWGRN